MAWVLRLVETGIDGPARVIDVMDITPVGALGDMSKLGLMLSEAKQILARLQQAVVAIQADDHAVRRPACSGCGHCETGVIWLSYCRSTPELARLRAHVSALMPYRPAAGLLAHLLPLEA